MGDFSRDTFDRLKHYVSVRLQQGVPVVDADWNELQDIRKFELEAFLKWFVGDGVPYGNDGFAIGVVVAADNDVSIADGRCLVEGWDVVNDRAEQHGGTLLRYTSQPLFGNADLVDAWGVAELPALTTPGSDRTDTVYLDVWERQVDSGEDDTIVNPDIGLETSVRTKREWVARVAEGVAVPAPAPGHVHYPLATLNRTAGAAAVDDVVDLRRTGLTVHSHHDFQQVVTDAYGDEYTLDGDGQPNLKTSLREAINAILAGGLPGTAAEQLTLDVAEHYDPSAFQDANGDVWVFWRSYRSGDWAIWYKRYDRIEARWTAETQLTSQAGDQPLAFEDSVGDVWLFWLSISVWYKRYDRLSETWGQDTELTSNEDYDAEDHAVFGDGGGNIWVFWHSYVSGSDTAILYKRYDRANNKWGDDTQLTLDPAKDLSPTALEDSTGVIWVFWRSARSGNADIWYKTYDGTTWTDATRLTWSTEGDYNPFVLEDSSGDILVVWERNNDLWLRRHQRSSNSWGSETQLNTPGNPFEHFAVAGTNGGVWILWYTDGEVYYKRYSAESGWGPVVPMAAGGGYNYEPTAFINQEEETWIFWNHRTLVNNIQNEYIWYRRLTTQI